MSNSLIRSIKQALADALLGDPYFANIPIMPIIANDIMAQIQEGQYRAAPVTILIDWMSVANSNPDTPGPWFDQGIFLVEILELPSMNDTGIDVDEAAENAANTLHLQPLNSVNACAVMGIGKADNDEFGRNIRQLRIAFPFGFKPRAVPSIAPVIISPLTQGDQLVSLTCVTPGAAIFYTLDGSYPAPRNPAANLYMPFQYLLNQDGSQILNQDGSPLYIVSPIQVLAGQLLKARAWLAGYSNAIPDTAQFQF